jgi:hypothetical protein
MKFCVWPQSSGFWIGGPASSTGCEPPVENTPPVSAPPSPVENTPPVSVAPPPVALVAPDALVPPAPTPAAPLVARPPSVVRSFVTPPQPVKDAPTMTMLFRNPRDLTTNTE